jgi:hypothetical protein
MRYFTKDGIRLSFNLKTNKIIILLKEYTIPFIKKFMREHYS